MQSYLSRLNRVWFTSGAVVVLMGGCVHKPIVVNGSTCTITWERVDDPLVKEYQVTVSPSGQPGERTKDMHRISSEITQVPCRTVGARNAGSWVASVRACKKQDVCSDPTEPVAFTIVDQ